MLLLTTFWHAGQALAAGLRSLRSAVHGTSRRSNCSQQAACGRAKSVRWEIFSRGRRDNHLLGRGQKAGPSTFFVWSASSFNMSTSEHELLDFAQLEISRRFMVF